MDISKQDVLDFVDKVELKAVNSIRDRYDKKEAKVYDDLFAQNGLSGTIQKAQALYNELHGHYQHIAGTLSEAGFTQTYRYTSTKQLLDKEPAVIQNDLQEMFKTDNIKDLQRERREKVSETHSAYNIVKGRLKRMRSVPKMVKYLEGLGFDASYLNRARNKELDTSKLFPCGEAS